MEELFDRLVDGPRDQFLEAKSIVFPGIESFAQSDQRGVFQTVLSRKGPHSLRRLGELAGGFLSSKRAVRALSVVNSTTEQVAEIGLFCLTQLFHLLAESLFFEESFHPQQAVEGLLKETNRQELGFERDVVSWSDSC